MPQTRIRFKQTATLYTPTVDTDGRTTLGAGTAITCAFWRTTRREFLSQIGETRVVDGTAFVPSGTSVSLRDRLLVAGALFEVINIHEAHDDRNRTDHIGVMLRLVSG